jgi:radical SAM superfamily enzyme YgiQ (UPF0313 family)
MASLATSRGCSFDCNFCAIWELYERRTRYMSAKAICDRLEANYISNLARKQWTKKRERRMNAAAR